MAQPTRLLSGDAGPSRKHPSDAVEDAPPSQRRARIGDAGGPPEVEHDGGAPPDSGLRPRRRAPGQPLGDAACVEVVKAYLPLVRKMVRRLSRGLPPSVERDDLLAAGLLGLIDSIRKNGDADGETFAGYAKMRIRGAIVDELRAHDWLSRRARESVGDGAGGSFVGLHDVTPAEESVHLSTGDDPIETLEATTRRKAVLWAVEQLPERERFVVGMLYFQGAKLREIAAELGVSEPRVSQLHARALCRLRGILRAA